jgi:hypothetical protein
MGIRTDPMACTVRMRYSLRPGAWITGYLRESC